MRNLHKLYYKDYFSDVDFLNLGSDSSKRAVLRSNQILTAQVQLSDLIIPDLGKDLTELDMQVLYPGLVTGIGIQHEASIENEFKLGLHLDYTTGLPVIYGSSVKGVLKSYFDSLYGGNDVERLMDDIFSGKCYHDNTQDKSIYDRDIFYDAVIKRPNRHNKILESDSFAPHGTGDLRYPLVEPTPITFVKIASGVEILFRFKLVDTKDRNGRIIMSKSEKKELFKQILTTFGIGAKTNVGYGQLKAI